MSVQNVGLGEQVAMIAGTSCPEALRIERSELKRMRASLKEGFTSEIKCLLVDSQKDL